MPGSWTGASRFTFWSLPGTRQSRPPRNFPGEGGFVCEAVTGFEPV